MEMTKTEYSSHKSMMLSIRDAMGLYLRGRGRKKDIPVVASNFLCLSSYRGDRVPITDIAQEIEVLCNVLQDDHLGLNLNALVDIRSLPLYQAISECVLPFSNTDNEPPFLLISNIIVNFSILLSQSIELKLTADKGVVRFDFTPKTPEIINKHQIDGVMVILHRITESFCPGRLEQVYVAHRTASYEMSHYRAIFGREARLADTASLVYDLRSTSHYQQAPTLLTKSEKALNRKFSINPLINMLIAHFPNLNCKQVCEIVIKTLMGTIPPTRINVANEMNLSLSTLQRKLRAEGASYQEILDDIRKIEAKRYLAEKTLSMADIAALLGYKSYSQFFTAFKKWFGETPRSYQDNQPVVEEDNTTITIVEMA